MRMRSLNVWEVVAALALVGLGAFMVWEASGYPFGSLRRMGPGFFPVWLGIVLMVFGALLVFEVSYRPIRPPRIPLRPLVMIPSGLLVFALLLERVGLVPATAALVLLSALGNRPAKPRAILWTTIGITALAYVVLIRAIGLPVNAFWW